MPTEAMYTGSGPTGRGRDLSPGDPVIGSYKPWGPDDGFYMGSTWEDYIIRGGYLEQNSSFPVSTNRNMSELAQIALTFIYARSWAQPEPGYLFALPGASSLAMGLASVPDTLTHDATYHMIPAGEWQEGSKVRMVWEEFLTSAELPAGPGFEEGVWRSSQDWTLHVFNLAYLRSQLPGLAQVINQVLEDRIPVPDLIDNLRNSTVEKMGYWRPGVVTNYRPIYLDEDRSFMAGLFGDGNGGEGDGPGRKFPWWIAAAVAAKVLL